MMNNFAWSYSKSRVNSMLSRLIAYSIYMLGRLIWWICFYKILWLNRKMLNLVSNLFGLKILDFYDSMILL
jgi:hypothetical protein